MAKSVKFFREVDKNINFPKLEEEILKYWERKKIFKKSIEKNKKLKPFIFYEGPPTANGKPGIHHVEARSFKDIIPRYKTMQGFYCERKAGWDCHGLPVELEVEKRLGISGKAEIENLGIEEFCNLCRKSVFEYVSEWSKVTKRIGYWVDLDDAYETLRNSFIESEWFILKQIWEKGWLYEDYKVVPYCSRCGTSLSSHELALGYKDDVEDPSIFVKFKLRKEQKYLLAWTTTPWTLPGNLALAVSAKEDYVELETSDGILILAKKSVRRLKVQGKILRIFKGKELLGKEYEPLYSFLSYDEKTHFVVPADFVSTEDGTGVVHTAVMYGEDDFRLGKKHSLPQKHLVNEKGQFISEVTPWAGMFVKKADTLIIKDLEKRGILFRSETIKHTYPFCWRCGTPLLYYAMVSWYLKTTAVKEDLLKNNDSVNWIPDHIKEGRMGEWLRNNRDWALSRSRYWGTPLPVWRCGLCDYTKVIGSVKELSDLSGKDQSGLDLHRPYVDEVTFKCEVCEGEMTRVSFVIDCWFDSGAMPYAAWHYPFENKDKFGSSFPADYIAEAIDQTRGWFYTLQAVSSLLEKGSSYKNVISLGHVLDEKGNKMSKSKGNIVDPWEVLNNVGADATRWYFYSVVSPGPSFRFSTNLVRDVVKRFLLVLWNSYNYFSTYANLSGWIPNDSSHQSSGLKLAILDKWILIRLQDVVNKVTEFLDKYDMYNSTIVIEDFVSNDFSKWYIRRSRGRDDAYFFNTFYQVLVTLSTLIAPFMPFVSEKIFRDLTKKESVHLEAWPSKRSLSKKDIEIMDDMDVVRDIVEKGHAVRKEKNIPVRQPLSEIIVRSPKKLDSSFLKILAEELNVKKVKWNSSKMLRVKLDTKITPELEEEGKTRNLIRKVQDERKKMGIKLDQKVQIQSPWIPTNKEFTQLLKNKTLALIISKGDFRVTTV